MKVGDLVRDYDYGLNGIIVGGEWSFHDTDGNEHTWEFKVLFEDGFLAGSDHFSLQVLSRYLDNTNMEIT